MTIDKKINTTFNSPLEAGIRAVALLVDAYPKSFDLYRLVAFDYLVVHTGDVGGPPSLHPQLPLRTTELLVRRKIIESGLLLMMSRGLIERIADKNGIVYSAGEIADTFLSSLTSSYLKELRQCSNWVIRNYGDMNDSEFKLTFSRFFEQWIEEFQDVQISLGSSL